MFIVFVVLLVVAYDLFAIHRWGEEATITAVIRYANHRWPFVGYLIIFFFGAVVGHLFWQ